jgi:multisubunit Na+/H+ antiporter MnhE subunit
MEELNNLPLDLSFDVPSLIAGLIFGIVGLYVFRRGKKESSLRLVMLGLALMIYPYFVEGAVLNWLAGFLLSGASYYYWDAA